jgi:DNA-binding MarR family transcriptional regulator
MNVKPEDTIGYWIASTHRSINAALSDVLQTYCQEQGKPYEITIPQWGALYQILVSDGLNIGTISQRRNIDASAVTNVIGRLEQYGLVERLHDRQDRRVVKVYLTDEGRELMRVLPDIVEAFYEKLIRDIPEEELQGVQAVLQKLIANVSP